MSNNYIECRIKEKIIKVLEDLKVEGRQISLWQTASDASSTRVAFDSYIYSVDKKKNILIIEMDKPILSLALSTEHQLYIHGNKQSIVFKSAMFKVKNKKVIVLIPESIMIIDLRDNARFELENKPNKYVLHQKEVGLAGSMKYIDFSIPCIDISQTGIALKLRSTHLTKYHIGDSISLISISEVPILNNIKATILYVVPYKNDKGAKYFKAGLNFSETLDEETLSRVLVNSESEMSQ
jgi:hypothetical protein